MKKYAEYLVLIPVYLFYRGLSCVGEALNLVADLNLIAGYEYLLAFLTVFFLCVYSLFSWYQNSKERRYRRENKTVDVDLNSRETGNETVYDYLERIGYLSDIGKESYIQQLVLDKTKEDGRG